MLSRKILAVAAVAATAAVATSASAQQAAAPAAAAPAQQLRHGAPIPGLCTYSSDRTIAGSEVGKYVGTRMKQLIDEVNAELKGEDTAVTNEAKALDAGRASLTPDAFEKRAADLQIRANALGRKKDQRTREIQLTERKALQRVLQELDPVIVGLYQQRQCSILLGDGVLAVAPQMDLTDQAIAGLNAKLKTFAFNRERLDAPTAAPAAAPKR